MKKIFLILVMTLSVFVSRAQQISVNTDVTMLMMQVYNAGAEMTIGNRSTLGLSVLGTKNPYIKKDMKLVAIQPEYRYYFGGRPLYHHFVGLGLLAADYNFVQKGKRYDGYALGAGLTFGYVFALTNNLNVDFHAGFGLVRTSYTKTYLDGSTIYVNGTTRPTEEGFVGMRLIPTKIGVSLSYTLW